MCSFADYRLMGLQKYAVISNCINIHYLPIVLKRLFSEDCDTVTLLPFACKILRPHLRKNFL